MNTENLTNEVEQQKVTMYVTYGSDTQQAFNYSVVRGSSPEDCRKKVFEVTGGRFAFMYSEKQFEGQLGDYGLTEIPLTPQRADRDTADPPKQVRFVLGVPK